MAWTEGSLAWRWAGHAWRSVALPQLNNLTLNSVAFLGRSDAWAVGSRSGPKVPYHAVVEHWDGTRWSPVALPHLHESALYGVSAAGPRSLWVVGTNYRRIPGKRYPAARPLLLHWDGASWRRQPLPWANPALQLSTVVATGPSSVWVTGHDSYKARIERFNGIRWRLIREPFGSNDPLAGFSATAGNDAWAVGSYRNGAMSSSYSHALVAHWNGYHWQITPLPNPPGANSAALVDVAAASPNDAWAIGQSQQLKLDGHGGASVSGTPATYFTHWNGQNWQITPGVTPWHSQSPP